MLAFSRSLEVQDGLPTDLNCKIFPRYYSWFSLTCTCYWDVARVWKVLWPFRSSYFGLQAFLEDTKASIMATQNPTEGNFGERSQIVQWHRNMMPYKMTTKMVDLCFLAFQGNKQVLLWYGEFDNGFPRKLKLILLFFPQQNICSRRGKEHEIWQSKRAPGIGE